MTRVCKIALGILATTAVVFAVACGGNSDGDQRPNDGRSGNQTSVSQQAQQENLEKCPPQSQTIVRDMRCVAQNMSVTAGPGSYVEARGGSTVRAGTGSWVEAHRNSTVYAYDGSTIRWRVGATIHIKGENIDSQEVFD